MSAACYSERVVGDSSPTVSQITGTGKDQSKVRVGGKNEAAGAAVAAVVAVE
jgi:hypothetical protein